MTPSTIRRQALEEARDALKRNFFGLPLIYPEEVLRVMDALLAAEDFAPREPRDHHQHTDRG